MQTQNETQVQQTNLDTFLPDVQDELLQEGAPDWGTAQISKFQHDGRQWFIPWQPTSWSSRKTRDKIETLPNPPAFINNLQALMRNPQDERLARRVLQTAAKEMIIKSQLRVEAQAWQGCIVLTKQLPWNVAVVDDEFVYISSQYISRTGVKWDFDGDMIRLAFHPYQREQLYKFEQRWPGRSFRGRPAVPIKNPISRAVQPVYMLDSSVLSTLSPETWFPFTSAEREVWDARDAQARAKEVHDRDGKSEEETIWRKTHEIQEVGPIDTKVKSYFLRTLDHLPLAEKQARLYQGDIAFQNLENNALGAVRKDHSIMSPETRRAVELVESNTWRVPTSYAPYLTSTGRVGSQSNASVQWAWQMDIPAHLRRISNLDIPIWRPASQRPELLAELYQLPERHTLIEDLVGWKTIQYEIIPRSVHQDQSIPPAIRCWLVRKGKPVALTDIRKAQGVIEGLTYSFILPPVWSVLKNKWVSPLQHMADCAQPIFQQGLDELEMIDGLDVRIINPQNGEHVRNWGRSAKGMLKPGDIFDPLYSYKLDRFQEWLSAHVGRYGLVVPTVSPSLEIPLTNRTVAANTAVVDYGPIPYNLEEWWSAWQQIPKVLCPASKGDDRRVRKYALNAQVGSVHPWWTAQSQARPELGPRPVNPRRSGQMLSQMSRVHKMCDMVVAICLPNPQTGNIPAEQWGETHQVQITDSGIQKQILDGPLGDTVFNNWVSHQPVDGVEPTEFMSLRGDRRVAWLQKAKSSKKIGKLIDGMGGKFMPCPALGFRQAWYLTDEQVAQVPKEGSEVQLLRDKASPKEKDEWQTYTIQSIQDQTVIALNELGQKVQLPLHRCCQPIVKKVRHEVDLFYPVQELVDKGLYRQYMQNAEQRIVELSNGQQVVCWVCTVRMWRTSTPTENMRPRLVHSRIRGLDAHLVVAGARRAGLEQIEVLDPLTAKLKTAPGWDIECPNLDYVQTIKAQVLDLLAALGYSYMLPTQTDMLFEQWAAQNMSNNIPTPTLTMELGV